MTTSRPFLICCALALACCAAAAPAAVDGTKVPPPPPPRGPAMLTVSAQPQPAKVFLDSADLGYAPIRIPQNDTLVHQLTVEAPWFRTWTMPVKFDPIVDRQINATLRRKEGLLLITTEPPGAAIRINGRMAGYAPLTQAGHPAGIYQVSAELTGYRTASATITVEDEQVSSWSPALEAKLGSVRFSGWPPQSAVIYRQSQIGTIPMIWENLKPGSYSVEIQRPGFEPRVLRCLVDPDVPAAVDVRLRPTSAMTAMARSLLLPGSGQIYRGYKVKGLIFEGAWFVTLGALAVTVNDRMSRYENLEDATMTYRRANKLYGPLYQQVVTDFYAARSANHRLNVMLAIAAVAYVVNLVDAAFCVPNHKQFKDPDVHRPPR